MLRAYDKTNGREVGTVFMPAQQSGTPMTYAVDGTQYVRARSLRLYAVDRATATSPTSDTVS